MSQCDITLPRPASKRGRASVSFATSCPLVGRFLRFQERSSCLATDCNISSVRSRDHAFFLREKDFVSSPALRQKRSLSHSPFSWSDFHHSKCTRVRVWHFQTLARTISPASSVIVISHFVLCHIGGRAAKVGHRH